MVHIAERPPGRPPAPGRQWRWRDLLLLGAVAASLNAAVWFGYHPRLSFSDEIVYATIGRNIAAGRGIVASHYRPDSIVEKGYPSLYLHMPGHPLMLAPAFVVFGGVEAAAYLPNWVSFAAVGMLLYGLGAGLGRRSLGLLAALLYYACPIPLTLANTVMSEPTLALLATLHLAVWLRAALRPHWSWALWLAACLVVGMIHHETFLALLPASLALAFWLERSERARFVAALFVTTAVLTALVFWPLHQARALEGHYTFGLISQDLGAIVATMLGSLSGNLVDLVSSRRGGASGTLSVQLPYLAMIALLAARRWLQGPFRWVLGFTASGFWLIFLGLALFYPVVRIGPKHLLLFVPAMCLLFAALLDQVRPRLASRVAALVAICVLAVYSQRDVSFMMRSQAVSYNREKAVSKTIQRYTAALQPRTALVENSFLYAWDAWPIDVVFFGAGLDGGGFDRVNQRLPIDVAALPGLPVGETGDATAPPRLNAALLQRGYVLVGREGGIWVYVAERLAPVRRDR